MPKWFMSPDKLFALKTGEAEDDFVENWATRRGSQGEPIIRRVYESESGIPVNPVYGEMDEHPLVRSSFDGITFDAGVLVEIKCPGEKVHKLAAQGRVVDYYKPQLVHQGLTAWGDPTTPGNWTKDRESHFVSGHPETRKIHIVRVAASRMREYACKLLEGEIAFWERVKAKLPPSGTGWADLAAQWIEAEAKLKEAKDAKAFVETAMEQYALANRLSVAEGGGVRFKQEERAGAIDYKAALTEIAGEVASDRLEKFRRKGSSSWIARPIK